MTWFDSSAVVEITNEFHDERSLRRWIVQGWFVPVAYLVGFAAMLVVWGWDTRIAA